MSLFFLVSLVLWLRESGLFNFVQGLVGTHGQGQPLFEEEIRAGGRAGGQ